MQCFLHADGYFVTFFVDVLWGEGGFFWNLMTCQIMWILPKSMSSYSQGEKMNQIVF